MDDNIKGAFSQARAQLESIKEMVEALDTAFNGDSQNAVEDAERAIHEDALEIAVRTNWHAPGAPKDDRPAEYMILLCTGGPAVRIVGTLDEFGQPDGATLEAQDWFTPWVRVPISGEDEAALMRYASCFYFGE